jgi:hypothetical protein
LFYLSEYLFYISEICLSKCETWVPLGPHRPGSRPSLTSGSGLVGGLTRPPEDLSEDFPDDLIQNDLKTWRTRQDLGGF